jgi:hypothetical protein
MPFFFEWDLDSTFLSVSFKFARSSQPDGLRAGDVILCCPEASGRQGYIAYALLNKLFKNITYCI